VVINSIQNHKLIPSQNKEHIDERNFKRDGNESKALEHFRMHATLHFAAVASFLTQ
jgi:hypothetical protein